VKLGSWNEKDNPDLPRAQVLADARAVAKRFRGANIIGGQEFGDVSDHDAVRKAFGRRWGQLFLHRQTPIIFNRIWYRVLACSWHKTHDGIEDITPVRGWSEGSFRNRFRPRLAPFWFLCTHCISKPGDSTQRAELHAHHIELMRERIRLLLDRDGRDIFVVGDFNVTKTPHLHDDQVVLHHHWLDHIIYIPGPNGNRIELKRRFTMHAPLHTDHQPIGVRVALSRKATA